MKWILGLGNPGEDYAPTRHNVGFRVIDEIRKIKPADFKKERRRRLLVGKRTVAFLEAESVHPGMNEKVILAKPLTFMNRSGEVAKAIFDAYSIKPEDLLVICDDIDLALGVIRLRPKGSSGGHKGLQSVIDLIGTDQFPRLRIGIRSGEFSETLKDFVLQSFSEDELKNISPVIHRAALASECWASEGITKVMNLFN